MSQIDFKLPIAHLESTYHTDPNIIKDLELINPTIHTSSDNNTLYSCVFDTPSTVFNHINLDSWSQYYTSNIHFLQDTQKLIKKDFLSFDSSYIEMDNVWKEMRAETGFCEKYQYIDWAWFKDLNHNAFFLQILSMYNMSSPIFSLALPILFLIMPFFLLRAQGRNVSCLEYYNALRHVLRNHQIGQIFNMSSVEWDKRIYILLSFGFYIFQIYQNILACIRFYQNMKKIHYQLFVIREFITDTIIRMEAFQNASSNLKTYSLFNNSFENHNTILLTLKKELDKITPWNISINKFNSVGHIMYCYYQTCQSTNIINALDFAIHFTGYCDNLNSIMLNYKKNKINSCTFSKKQTFFKNAYYPNIKHCKPIKNSYKLDKHILITGPNAAGKTTILKTTLFNTLLCQQIGFGFFKSAKLQPYDYIHCYINIPDTSGRDSLFQAEARRCKNILDSISLESNKRHFCVFDELYSGTNPYEAIASALSFLKYMNKYNNVSYVITTHFLDLCKRLQSDTRIKNCHMETENIDSNIKYKYKLKNGISSIRGGTKVLHDLNYPKEILFNAENTIDKLII